MVGTEEGWDALSAGEHTGMVGNSPTIQTFTFASSGLVKGWTQSRTACWQLRACHPRTQACRSQRKDRHGTLQVKRFTCPSRTP